MEEAQVKQVRVLGLMEMTVRWQDKNWTPLQLLSFIPIVTQRNREKAGHEVKTSGPVEYSVELGNVHVGPQDEVLLKAKWASLGDRRCCARTGEYWRKRIAE